MAAARKNPTPAPEQPGSEQPAPDQPGTDAEDTGTRRRSEKWNRRREEVIDRSAAVFAERGYHGTGTTELCEANELGKGALYYYIGSKEELLAAIHDRVMGEVLNDAERVVRGGGPPADQLAALGTGLLDVITRRPHHVWVVLHDFPALTGENAARFNASRRAHEGIVTAVLEAGVASGAFRPLDPRLATRAWLGMHYYAYLWLRPGGELSAAAVAGDFADTFLRGITAGAAHPPLPPRRRA